jgi:hypothetical protein
MAQELSPDAKLIEQLARSGSDLGKLHRIEFLLRFPTQAAAKRAEAELLGLAFETKVERGKSDSEWNLTAAKRMYPLEPDLAGLRDKLNAIAATGKGSYDGWRARVYIPEAGK